MKKIGIVGGLAWPSTADYYRLLCKKTNEHFRMADAPHPLPSPPMIIESLNISETRAARGEDNNEASWATYDNIFKDAFVRLKKAGADFGMIASNTPHMRLESIRQGLDFPVVSILDTTASLAAEYGALNALVLGTPVTMKSAVYPKALTEHKVTSLPQPNEATIEDLRKIIDIDLYHGKIEGAADRILTISKENISNHKTDIVCLACTELPLAFPQFTDLAYFEIDGIRFINTIAAHVERALQKTLTDR